MKKIFLLALAVITISISNAQIEQGRKFIGSTLSISGYHNTYPDDTFYKSAEFSAKLNPRFGKFIRQNFAIGGGLMMGYSREIYNTQSNSSFYETLELKAHTFNYGAEFFARIYQPLTDKFYLHLDANIGISHALNYSNYLYTYSFGNPTTTKSESGTITSRVAVIPGVTYFAKPNFALELNFGLLHFSNALVLNDAFSNLSSVKNNYGFSFQASTVSLGANFFF